MVKDKVGEFEAYSDLHGGRQRPSVIKSKWSAVSNDQDDRASKSRTRGKADAMNIESERKRQREDKAILETIIGDKRWIGCLWSDFQELLTDVEKYCSN
jgi:hypothetical protein